MVWLPFPVSMAPSLPLSPSIPFCTSRWAQQLIHFPPRRVSHSESTNRECERAKEAKRERILHHFRPFSLFFQIKNVTKRMRKRISVRNLPPREKIGGRRRADSRLAETHRSDAIAIKLLTHNLLECHIKGVTNKYPFKVEASQVETCECDFNPDFLRRMYPK